MIKKSILLFSLSAFFAVQVFAAQPTKEERDRIDRLSREDHQLMMKQLGITNLRPGHPEIPRRQMPPIPTNQKPLLTHHCRTRLSLKMANAVKTAQQWEKRKLEIFEDFDREIYGRVPAKTPAVAWKVVSEEDTNVAGIPVVTKQLVGHVDNSEYPAITVDINMTLTTPKNKTAPVPVILEFGWNFPKGFKMPQQDGPTWQQQVLEKGWGYAVLLPTSIQADNGAGLQGRDYRIGQ